MSDEILLATVKVFEQRKGVSESDVLTALGASASINGKAGLVAAVLIPTIAPESRDAPGPRYTVRYPVQVMDYPVVRKAAGNSQLSAETLSERVRMLLHGSSFGRGQALYFDGQEPAPMENPGHVSYIVFFRRLGNDPKPPTVGTVQITATAPGVVVFSVAPVVIDEVSYTPTILYTIDGTFPGYGNPSAIVWNGSPVVVDPPATVRASAVYAGCIQGDVSQLYFALLASGFSSGFSDGFG
jgi:hypothetical protein